MKRKRPAPSRRRQKRRLRQSSLGSDFKHLKKGSEQRLPTKVTIPAQDDDPSQLGGWCHLVEAKCWHVECGKCKDLAAELKGENFLWVCSSCQRGTDTIPESFWKDGHCEMCEEYSPILMLILP